MNKAFENYVNYAGSKTKILPLILNCQFENYVNYAGSKTLEDWHPKKFRLRTM